MRAMVQFMEITRETITGDDTTPVLIQDEAVLMVRPRSQKPYQGSVTGSVLHLQGGIAVTVAEDLGTVRTRLAPPQQLMGPR